MVVGVAVLDEIIILENFKKSGQRQVSRIQHSKYGECIMKRGVCKSTSSLERMKREVKILRDINSIYYPKNFEFKCNEIGEFIIYEQYIKSHTLTELAHEFINDEQKVIRLCLNIIEGLELLWTNNIVHRDLKPDNILINDGGMPIIIDLGIARVLDDKSLTMTMSPHGPCTPIYASPEQLNNSKGLIDKRSDFYSLGIIMAELLLGYHPFSVQVVGEGMSTLENMMSNKYQLSYSNIMISIELKKVINRLLMTKPYQRYRTSEMLKNDLNKLLQVKKEAI